ncbi:MAG TPA: tripartite tricarboxylate transporter substrate binding protein [Burkholderiales bacterium]|jgi:tripartite-type tricarboxylate transporter receptor subunit TctC|nr:tripartite tricarboxylate transporter substrate binding protein [Burkholderiales bacterium]
MSSAGLAQQYPAKPIRLLVGFAAGGPSDVASRTVGQKLTQKWGQQIIVDIRPGAGGTIASDAVAKAPPDGYTLLLPAFSHAVNPSLISKLPYDTLRDFTPIVLFASTANMLVTHPSIPAKTVRELIAFAKARPNQLTYGSAGNGTASHLAGELLNTMGGVSITHVPYKGIAPAHTDTMGGQISMMFDSLVTAIPAVKAGRLRAFGVTTLKRWPGAPDVPTMSEAGLAGYEVNSWYGVMGPAGLSKEIVQRLNAEVIRSMAEPDARERLYSIGAEPMSNTPEEFAAYIRSEMAKWDKVVKAAGIRAE